MMIYERPTRKGHHTATASPSYGEIRRRGFIFLPFLTRFGTIYVKKDEFGVDIAPFRGYNEGVR